MQTPPSDILRDTAGPKRPEHPAPLGQAPENTAARHGDCQRRQSPGPTRPSPYLVSAHAWKCRTRRQSQPPALSRPGALRHHPITQHHTQPCHLPAKMRRPGRLQATVPDRGQTYRHPGDQAPIPGPPGMPPHKGCRGCKTEGPALRLRPRPPSPQPGPEGTAPGAWPPEDQLPPAARTSRAGCRRQRQRPKTTCWGTPTPAVCIPLGTPWSDPNPSGAFSAGLCYSSQEQKAQEEPRGQGLWGQSQLRPCPPPPAAHDLDQPQPREFSLKRRVHSQPHGIAPWKEGPPPRKCTPPPPQPRAQAANLGPLAPLPSGLPLPSQGPARVPAARGQRPVLTTTRAGAGGPPSAPPAPLPPSPPRSTPRRSRGTPHAGGSRARAPRPARSAPTGRSRRGTGGGVPA
ncbi:vegetative cell wall protein gp1-like isoform X1 [Vulpes lagopus]|uniref:vegetative cell wall protein gp1-like isoform X1 n=1 Tax=Vulpes lagopus TaxID=494514 RepID=UPI001BC97553|nr:vegetative cell wall protein gp1-like isoform X1 [Vulpes lagopus]